MGIARGRARWPLVAVGAENEYADVIAQVGGRDVKVSAIETNPNTDPHSFEASPSVARGIGSASLVVQNGLGYDSYMDNIESARRTHAQGDRRAEAPAPPNSTPNPHLWYSPSAMPKVANAIAPTSRRCCRRTPPTSGRTRRASSARSTLGSRRCGLRDTPPATPIAVTEPVADDLLRAAST